VDEQEAIRVLRELPELVSAYHKTQFVCFRKNGEGGQRIEIELLDSGPNPPQGYRFQATARSTTDAGVKQTFSGGETVDLALRTLRLFELD
jgi:hypothetical protein